MKLTINSWNVLHIVHELNHALDSSPVLDEYKITAKDTVNEAKRLVDIFKTIVKSLNSSSTVFCLQEVPGDLFDMLSELKDYVVYSYKYNREPVIKNKFISCPYKNSSEYLVTIVPADLKDLVVGTDCVQSEDPGKASFIVHFKFGLSIVNCHVPFGDEKRCKAFGGLFDCLEKNDHASNYVIIGDMNCRFPALKEALTSNKFTDFNIPRIIGDTRKGKQNGKVFYNKIDHCVVHKKLKVGGAWVTETGDLSDHYIIGMLVY